LLVYAYPWNLLSSAKLCPLFCKFEWRILKSYRVYVCSNKHGTHKPSRIDLNPMAAEFWPSSPSSSSSGSVVSSRSEVLSSLSDTQQSFRSETVIFIKLIQII
jgi:hypothetical protein